MLQAAGTLFIQALAFFLAFFAWHRDIEYKLRATAAQDCLVAFYAFADRARVLDSPVRRAPAGDAGKLQEEARLQATQRVDDMWTAFREYQTKLRLASFHITLPMSIYRDPPVRGSLLEERLRDTYRDYLTLAGAYGGVSEGELESARRSLWSLIRDDDMSQGLIGKLRVELEAVLMPHTKPGTLLELLPGPLRRLSAKFWPTSTSG